MARQAAGGFFAAYGPPVSDVESGSSTVYSWKGGYKTRRIPAEYAKTTDGKRGKQTAPARTVYLSCSVQITTDADYIIRSIRILGDRKTDSGRATARNSWATPRRSKKKTRSRQSPARRAAGAFCLDPPIAA